MTKKILYIIATSFLLTSCTKEEEYVSYILATEKPLFKDTSAVLRGVIVAPGKVNISECAFIIYDPFVPNESSKLSLGKIDKPGKIEATIDTLKMGHQYKYYIYSESQGKVFLTPEDSAMTTEGNKF
jgi:hypothetical protein